MNNLYASIDEKQIVLSILVSSHDRLDFLRRAVHETLKARSHDFEVVIVDDSHDDIYAHIDSDLRLKIYHYDNVTTYEKAERLIRLARGKYCMTCLDKDMILGVGLDDFLSILREHPEICGGICAQNKVDKLDKTNIFKEESIMKFGYRLRHPTGEFFLRAYQEEMLNKNLGTKYYPAITNDFLLAGCSTLGPMLLYDREMILLEKTEDALRYKTLTYNQQNIFFHPRQRTTYFNDAMLHLEILQISKELKRRVVSNLYGRLLYQVTIYYRYLMSPQNVYLEHYNMKPRHINIYEMVYWYIFLTVNFFTRKMPAGNMIIKLKIAMRELYRFFIFRLREWRRC